MTFPLSCPTSFSHHPAWWPGLASKAWCFSHRDHAVQGEPQAPTPLLCLRQNEHCSRDAASGEGKALAISAYRSPGPEEFPRHPGSCGAGWDLALQAAVSAQEATSFPRPLHSGTAGLDNGTRSRSEALFTKISCRDQPSICTLAALMTCGINSEVSLLPSPGMNLKSLKYVFLLSHSSAAFLQGRK